MRKTHSWHSNQLSYICYHLDQLYQSISKPNRYNWDTGGLNEQPSFENMDIRIDPALPSLPSEIQATPGPPYTQLSTWNMPSRSTLGPDLEADPAIDPVKWEIYEGEATWLPSANVVVRVREVCLWFPGIVIKYLIGEGQALPS